jgi:hypothetical protein
MKKTLLFLLLAPLLYAAPAHAGWLTDLTNWFGRQIRAVFTALVDFLKDLLELQISFYVDVILTVLNAIPVPDFLGGFTICGILSGGGGTVIWALTTMRVPEGMVLIAGGFAFYVVRKIFTLGQW